MKKKNFLEGAFISSLGIVICKVLGLLYVIPFYSIIGTAGGVLYSYGYSIYSTFLNFSTLGIPTAMSKIISEYQALGYENTKERVYKLGKNITLILSVIIFLILIIFSKQIATYILGGESGTFTVGEVSSVINIISFAILVVPLLSVVKGYIQGHKFMVESSVATVLEQLVRVVVIVVGSFLAVKVFNLSINTAVGIAMFGAFLGAFSAYFYLIKKISKNKKEIRIETEVKSEEKKISTKMLLKQITIYAFPFVMIELLKTFYSIIDMTTIIANIKQMYGMELAETTYSVLTTWGPKINMIGLSIGSGVIISLIPTIAAYYIKKDYKKINEKLGQALEISMYVIVPITLLLCFLAGPVWTVFYGYDAFCTQLLRVYVLQIIWVSLYSLLLNLNQAMSETKTTILILVVNLTLKLVLNVPMMWLLYHLNIGGYYGPMITNMIIYTISFIIVLTIFKKKHNFQYKDMMKNLIKIFVVGIMMTAILYLISFVLPINYTSRFGSLLYLCLYGILGVVIYIFITYKIGLFQKVFSEDFLKKFLGKFKRTKKV